MMLLNPYRFASAVPETDPYWSDVLFLLKSDGSTAYDASSIGHTFSTASVSHVSGQFGEHALSFNGSSQYLQFTGDATLALAGNEWTIDFWATRGSFTNLFQGVLSSAAASYGAQAYTALGFGSTLDANATRWALGGYAIDAASGPSETATSVLSTPEFIRFVRDGNVIYAYRNGVREGSVSYSGGWTLLAAANEVCVGRNLWDGANGWYHGLLQDLRVTAAARSTGLTHVVPTGPAPTS